jgi:hypothetical protein
MGLGWGAAAVELVVPCNLAQFWGEWWWVVGGEVVWCGNKFAAKRSTDCDSSRTRSNSFLVVLKESLTRTWAPLLSSRTHPTLKDQGQGRRGEGTDRRSEPAAQPKERRIRRHVDEAGDRGRRREDVTPLALQRKWLMYNCNNYVGHIYVYFYNWLRRGR